jgi:hypothetical protein
MGEIVALSLFMGSLVLPATGSWWRWRQLTRREREEEEEAMTPYDSQETLQSISDSQRSRSGKPPKDPRLVGWEFKIVRAQRNVFHDPLVFQQMCEEEANAGWILLEKLDDRRVRFKRPIALREIVKADLMPVDPYRSHYGSSSRISPWLLGLAGLFVAIVPAYLAFMLVSKTLPKPAPEAPTIPAPLPSLNPPSGPPP